MKLSLLFCFLFLFLAISCGSDNDDDDNGTVNTPTTNEDDRQNEDDNDRNDDVVSKYTSILLKADEIYVLNYEHSLRLDLGRRPVIVTGNFKDAPNEEVEGQTVACTFQARLTEAQADRVERLANRLKFCSRDMEIEEQVDFSEIKTITATDRSGKTTEAFKQDMGDDLNIDQTWLCGGRTNFYSYVKRIVGPKIPENCPAGALNKL